MTKHKSPASNALLSASSSEQSCNKAAIYLFKRQKSNAKDLAIALCKSIRHRLRDLRKAFSAETAEYTLNDFEEHCSDYAVNTAMNAPDRFIRIPRRFLICHLPTVVDINEYELELLN